MATKLPLVLQVLLQFREELLGQEAAQMDDMASLWLGVEDRLEIYIAALADRIAVLTASGEVITPSQIFRLERFQSLMAQAEREIMNYANWADDLITGKQAEWAKLGLQSAAEAIEAVQMQNGIQVGGFDRLPVEAVTTMAGFLSDGSPLMTLLGDSWNTSADGLAQALINATALGENPRVTARLMRDGLSNGLDRMLNIARTEQLRAYRESSRAEYKESGVVTTYKRLAAQDDRTCLACIESDGDVYELDVPLDEHNSGRCALVPVVKGLPEVEWKSAHDWFLEQDESTQRGMMGPGMFDAWQGGKFDLADIVAVHHDDTWGDSVGVRSLASLLGE